MKPTSTGSIAVMVLLAWAVFAPPVFGQIAPGTIIYDFDTGTNSFVCDPDDWTFFGNPTTDFGSLTEVEDGHGVFHAGDWTLCDQFLPPSSCQFMGSIIGIERPCLGQPVGIPDANLDLSLGTGLSVRVFLDLSNGIGGTEGARYSLELEDDDGTNAVVPGLVSSKPYVNRMHPLTDEWETVTFHFAGLDTTIDDAAIAGTNGLNLESINKVKLLWRRFGAQDINVFLFDNITLVDSAPQLWADHDDDGDVDLANYAEFQRCFGADLTPALVDEVLFDFESGLEGWSAFGVLTTDSGVNPLGSVGQGLFHVADFDADTSGLIVSLSERASTTGFDLSEYQGMKLDMRLVDVLGETPFAGTPEVRVILGHGANEFVASFNVTNTYATYSFDFRDMTPRPTPADLADPDLQIKLVMLENGNTGVGELDFDEITGIRSVASICEPLDANRDEFIDLDDYATFSDCALGADVTADFFSFCY